jgi:hypothetical protein
MFNARLRGGGEVWGGMQVQRADSSASFCGVRLLAVRSEQKAENRVPSEGVKSWRG